MKEEYEVLIKNDFRTIIDLPLGCKDIRCKWILRENTIFRVLTISLV